MQEYSNGEKKILMLCLECAKKQSVLGTFFKDLNLQNMLAHSPDSPIAFPPVPEEQLQQSLHQLLNSISQETEKDSGDKTEQQEESGKKCFCCGWKWDKWKETGKLGCEECYQTFKKDILDRLSGVQHKNIHTGRSPVTRDSVKPLNVFLSRSEEDFYLRQELNHWKKSLREAVAREEYGQAAELRDKIRDLEQLLAGKDE